MLFKIEQSCKLQKAILANQDAIWKTRLFQVDHITVEILSTNLHEFRTKSVGAVSRNMFCENQPHGGATTGLCEKYGAEVQNFHAGSVCAKLERDRTNGAGI